MTHSLPTRRSSDCGQGPARMIAAGDRLEQIAAEEVGIAARHLRCFGVGEERHALIRMEMVLHPEFLAGGIDPHVGMGAVAVHVPPGPRQTTLDRKSTRLNSSH